MPTYGYKCRECGHEFEILQKITDEPVKTCIKCKGQVNKVFHPVGIIFKGSGFYTTDYKRKSVQPPPTENKPEKAEAKDKPPGDKGKGDKGEKPEQVAS